MFRATARCAALCAAVIVGCAPADPAPFSFTAPTSRPSSAESQPAPSEPTVAAIWQRLPNAPLARLEMAVAAHDGRIWLAGGLSALGDALVDVDILDPATGAWTDGPSLPTAVHHAALVSDGERLVLLGGYLGSDFNRPTDLVLVLAHGDSTWRPGPSLPAARAAGASAWDGSRIVYAGGVMPGGSVAADVYALGAEAWERIGSMAQVREHLAATSDGAGAVWLLGGRVGGLDTNLGAVELVEDGEITAIGDLPTARGGVAAFWDADLGACLTGGEAPTFAFTTVECIGPGGNLTTLPELNEPHHGHGAAVIDGVAYVVLGGPEPTLSAGSTVEMLELGS